MVVGDFSKEVDTIVIGSGPGGYVAAIRASQLGQKVVIVEKEKIGGVCLNVGCIPSKALITAGKNFIKTKTDNPFGISYGEATIDFGQLQQWKNDKVVGQLTKGVQGLLKKNKVEIVYGTAFFNSPTSLHVMQNEGMGETYSFKNAIIATGSRPIEIPNLKFSENVVDSTGLLNLTEIPDSLVVIGGGYIGLELAGAYANLGAKVTILEGAPRILNGFEEDLVKPVAQSLKNKGMEIITEAKAQSYEEKDGLVHVKYEVSGETHTVSAEKVAVVVGRRPNTDELSLELAGISVDERGLIKVNEQGQTEQPNIYAIGDVTHGPALAHKASYEAKIAAEAISGVEGVAVDYLAIPTVCFTQPEIATVGLTEQEAKDQGLSTRKATFKFQSNGRALSMNETEGFVRLISDAESQRIVGAQMVGPEVSELIGEITLAIENLMTAEDLVLTIHNHPSLSETFMDASEILLGQGIHQ
ncbi:dihydrolipoyl dehydrogenase [Staphylococcus lutrae]|uniref:Dihydrolipoyl dehydrogenase n=1 Tax=Staphylococcus lutrae TaxID=155085 RepID=A0AAC9WJA7_9STAP|nr:dihydrolipoyl dehydrogenase [Staphylococcus lutrae]ARJ50838.1 dihydrolipoyl dehydrogenase [Staphylococcus lutrae]PNZ36806.1 dihydrolipoyl dehydrogenase [Staphylococcus lutrae]